MKKGIKTTLVEIAVAVVIVALAVTFIVLWKQFEDSLPTVDNSVTPTGIVNVTPDDPTGVPETPTNAPTTAPTSEPIDSPAVPTDMPVETTDARVVEPTSAPTVTDAPDAEEPTVTEAPETEDETEAEVTAAPEETKEPELTATPEPTATPKPTKEPVITEAPTEEPEIELTNYWFRTKKLRDSHFEKHGIEMGFETPEEYIEAANRVICNPDALHKLEAEDNDHVYFVEATNEFVVLSQDGYIRTYYIANGGIDYFNRQ